MIFQQNFGKYLILVEIWMKISYFDENSGLVVVSRDNSVWDNFLELISICVKNVLHKNRFKK